MWSTRAAIRALQRRWNSPTQTMIKSASPPRRFLQPRAILWKSGTRRQRIQPSKKYNGTLTSSGGFVTFTTQMAGLGKDEYFTKIKANVGSYEKDYVGYVSSRDQDPTSGYATTFGKLLTADADTYTNFASMKMYDTIPMGARPHQSTIR